MTLEEYLKNKQPSKICLRLIEKLKDFSEESDFIIGALVFAETESDKEKLLDYIENGEDVSYENILLYALELDMERDKLNNTSE